MDQSLDRYMADSDSPASIVFLPSGSEKSPRSPRTPSQRSPRSPRVPSQNRPAPPTPPNLDQDMEVEVQDRRNGGNVTEQAQEARNGSQTDEIMNTDTRTSVSKLFVLTCVSV